MMLKSALLIALCLNVSAQAAAWVDDFDGTKPNDYLTKFPIGLKGKQKVVGGKVVE